MRKFLTTSLIALALIFSAGVAAPTAHADVQPAGSSCDLGGGVLGRYDTSGNCVAEANYVSQSTAAAADQPTSVNAGDETDSMFNTIMIKILSLFSWLVGVAALALDYAVYYTVVNMGSYLSKLTAIGVTWRILRDIGNIMLIFGFLAIGISVILNTERLGWGKKLLPSLLVAAVFLNFSLFLTEAVIDAGNLFATQFYTQINGGKPATPFSLSTVSVANEGISNKLMSQLGLQTIYNINGTNGALQVQKANPWYVGFMGIILFMITAFVMFSLAFILIARFVYLVFLIILAPVGFAGAAIPQLAGMAKKWRDALFEQTITAPVLLLLLYVALAVITDAQFLIPGGSPTGFIDNANLPGFASYLLSFLIAMGLMLTVVISAKRLSAFGADSAMKWGSKLSGAALVPATLGLAGRYTAGAGSKRAAKGLRNTAIGRSFVGRAAADRLEKVSKSSFDVRASAANKNLLSKTGLNLGEAQKGGYEADLKSRVESYERASKGITGARGQTSAEAASIEEAKKAKEEAEKAHTEATRAHQDAAAEVNRLEEEKKKDKYFAESGREKELEASKRNLNEKAAKLSEAEEAKTGATIAVTQAEGKVAKATSEAGRKEAYQGRLKNAWGKVPFFGTAAAESVKKHSKEAKDKENLEKMVEEMYEKKFKDKQTTEAPIHPLEAA